MTETNPMIAAFYDAFLLYAYALNQTIEAGEDPHVANNLVRKVWNRTYFGGLTGDVYINQWGDREPDYTVNDLDVETGIMQPVGAYYGTRQVFEKVEGTEIQWPGRDNAPPDVPNCGFMGEAVHCLPEEGFPIVKLILFLLIAIIVIGSVVSFFVYKHVKLEASLADVWWRIDYNELEFFDERGQAGKKSTLSLASETSFMSEFWVLSMNL